MNKSVFDILEELEAVGGRLDKESILLKNVSNDLLRQTFWITMDPYVDFGVRKFDKPKSAPRTTMSDDDVLVKFLELLEHKLSTRALTGNAAKNAVTAQFAYMDARQRAWCKRILIRNLRVGVQSKTVNKIWKNLIVHFSVQLAHTLSTTSLPGDGGIVINDPVNYPVRLEPKLDGLRLVAVKRSGKVTMHTRNGNIVDTVPEIVAALESAEYDDIVLDGEIMGEDWNESASVVMSSKNAKDASNIAYNVFDAVTLEEWDAGVSHTPLRDRTALADDVVTVVADTTVKKVAHAVANNEPELIDFYTKCLDENFEGIMLKDMNASYEFGRTKSMLKMKPVTTYEGVIVSAYDGRDGTKWQGRFGGFSVLLPNGVITRCGGGFSDAFRKEVLKNGAESYTGKIVELEGQPPLTKDGRVRFPVFVRFRSASDVDPAVTRAYKAYSV